MAIKFISPLTGTLKSIKSQFTNQEKLSKEKLKLSKKRINVKAKKNEDQRRVDYERLLERKLSSIGRPIKTIAKKLNFFDSLRSFLVNVLLGFITLKLLPYLPQLLEVAKKIFQVGNFVLEVGGKLLNALVTFVDFGYKAADHARLIVGKIGGEKAVQNLDKMTGDSTKLMNQIIIAAMIFSDFNPFEGMRNGSSAFNKTVEAIKGNAEAEIAATAAETVKDASAVKAIGPMASGGIIVGTGLLLSAAGEGIFQITRWVRGLKSFSGPAASFFSVPLGFLEGAGTIFDILGAPFRYAVELIRAPFMKLFRDKKGLEDQAKNLGKFDARVRENIRRFAGLFSPLFTFFGRRDIAKRLQTPGSFGSLYGKKAVKDMGYQTAYGGGKIIKIKKFAKGGATTPIEREKEQDVNIPREEKNKVSRFAPGALVGGELGLAKVFPGSMDDPGRMDRYDYVTNTYYTISGQGSLGPIMSLTVKSLLGDKVSKEDYDIAADSLGNLMMLGLYEDDSKKYEKLSSLIDTSKINQSISSFLKRNLDISFSAIVNLLRSQIGLAPLPGDPVESKGDPCAAACDTGSGSGMAVSGDAVDKAILDLISSVEAQSYDTMNVSRGATAGKPTQMSVDWLESNANGAIGRYQHMPAYVKSRVIAAGFKGSDKFTAEVQDKTTLKFLYDSHGFARWRSGQMSDEEFGNRLSATWRGLPHSSGGTYPDRYAGQNKAHMSRPAFMSRLAQIKAGGSGTTMAKIAPGSPAASVDPCVCDPQTPTGDPGEVKAAGATTGGKISGYPVTSGYGMRVHPITGRQKMHGGIDIAGMRSGAPYALNVAGVAGPPPQYEGGYGNFIDIKIPSLGDLYFRFAHMSKPPNYKPGQQIPAGKIFGYAGTTGASTGVHLHFEVNKALSGYGGDRDPMPYGKYISIGKESGGPTLMGGLRKLHKGEYVIDKDSVDLFGGVQFLSLINRIENDNQRSAAASQLIQHLSEYTGRKIDQRPDVILANGETNLVQPLPSYVYFGSSGSKNSSGSPNWEQDMCFARA